MNNSNETDETRRLPAPDEASERWEKITKIFEAASALTGKEREKLLQRSCGDDAELRQEVEQLLASFENSDRFLDKPALAEAASLFAAPHQWLAFGLSLLLSTYVTGSVPGNSGFVAAGVWFTFLFVALTRFGLLATVAYFVCYAMILIYPISSDFSAWYAGGTIFVLGVVVAICGYGFYTSLGGQKVFAGKSFLED